jgi:hypothetical protein
MSNTKVNFTTPVGRMVMGDLVKPQTTDADGKPLLIKQGPNAGKPTQRFFIAVAIPKNPGETHWAQTEWGAKIWAIGHAAFPTIAQNPSFSWKVQDGDSVVPNKKGRKNVDTVGFKGCWVIFFQSSYPPKAYNADGSGAIPPESIKCGYFVQVNCDVSGNESTQNPGVYLNPSMVALSAFGEEIHFGPDPSQAGFGGAPLPAGAMSVPPAANLVPAAAPGVPQTPSAAYVPPPGVPAVAPPVIGAIPANPSSPPVVPNTAILSVPGTGVAPPVPPVPVAGPVMTPKAGATTYAAFIQGGWTDQQLRDNGYMV